jgi:hypothetical protein
MAKQKIISILRSLTNHQFIELTTRGNSAIKSALKIVDKSKKILIPEEGGWLTYPTIAKELGFEVVEVLCDNAKINLADLREKLASGEYGALLYQNPGGYFATQDDDEIYKICKKNNCLSIVDISGSIGTEMCNGDYADFLVCSFGKWKLVEAGKGGFISTADTKLWSLVEKKIKVLDDHDILVKIQQELVDLPVRISKLDTIHDKIVNDLSGMEIVYPNDRSYVVIIKFSSDIEKEKLINYCQRNDFPWTECPRYIRINQPAISIETKRL